MVISTPLVAFRALPAIVLGGLDSVKGALIGGLAIGIGKVANGSIIMVENIFRVLKEKKGQGTTRQLTAEGAHDVGTHLFSANLIILLVFLLCSVALVARAVNLQIIDTEFPVPPMGKPASVRASISG